ncbi:MAG: imidazolonepropionase [Thalassobaculales bacterium]
MWDLLIRDANLATFEGPGYGAISDGALAVQDGRIAWVGRAGDLPPGEARESVSLGGAWLLPGLIDCHTHIVHGGDRAAEFEMRLEGASYAEIARAGGGIRSTVAATRAAGEDALLASARRRLAPLLAEGVTTIEVKSGYGLDTATELKQLRVARRLAGALPVGVRTTLLALHALPAEFEGRTDDFVALAVEEMLPAALAEGLVDAVDAFCETIAFSPAQVDRLFAAARARGLPVKLHAEQLSNLGGAALAARHGALSADHLEYLDADGVAAMAAAGSVAVLLPGAFHMLRETKLPPVDLLRQHGVGMAVSTDCNPGTSPVTSLLAMLNFACTLFRLTPAEAIAGVTREAARALGLAGSHGTLAPGKVADLAAYAVGRPAELAYRLGFNPCIGVWKAGVKVA